ncbi:MAG: helix-turn-helix transcriptional regulator [Planctomycetes bacterium]|nr:helix-turn-helix transcriptional regulator [Planctomycetota bacterium]
MADTKVKSPATYLRELRTRLQRLQERFQQIEIARRTGTPAPNVNRYLKAGRIPAEFCLALADAFDLSADWVMRGEGEPVTSDVRAETSAKAGELLDLVKAMNAVARMRLGAVVGDRQRKVVRELAETLETFDRLRERMNERSRPVISALLGDLEDALARFEMPRATSLRETAVELSRLCTDDAVLERLDRCQASTEYLTGHTEEALKFLRRVFARRIRDGVLESDASLSISLGFVMQLRETARMAETIRVSGAILSLVPDALADHFSVLSVRVLHAGSLVEVGRLDEGLPILNKTCPKLPPDSMLGTVMLLRGLTLAGVMGYRDAYGYGANSRARSRFLVRLACFHEDAASLQHALDHLTGIGEHVIPPEEFDAQVAHLLLRATQGRKSVAKEYQQMIERNPPVAANETMRQLLITTHGAQVARHARDQQSLRHWTDAASAALRKVVPEFTPRVDTRVLHLRNLEAATTGSHKAQATALREDLQTWTKAGYHGLALNKR